MKPESLFFFFFKHIPQVTLICSDNHRLINQVIWQEYGLCLGQISPSHAFLSIRIANCPFSGFFKISLPLPSVSQLPTILTSHPGHIPVTTWSYSSPQSLYSTRNLDTVVFIFSLVEVINEITEDQVLWMTYIALKAHKC